MALYKYAYYYCNYYYYYHKDSEFLVQFYMCCGICWLGYVVRNSKAVCRQADAWIQESTDWTGQDHTWWDEKFTHANNQFFLKTRWLTGIRVWVSTVKCILCLSNKRVIRTFSWFHFLFNYHRSSTNLGIVVLSASWYFAGCRVTIPIG